MNIRSVLIANRGEIAVRIIRTCRDLGLHSVAIYSDADEGQLWTRLADEAAHIGGAPPRDSYLNIDSILAAAKKSGVDAIHPGYGLLSESPEFATAVAEAGFIFVGPSADVIAVMGDKVAARNAAIASGIPVLPGSEGAIDDSDAALKIAEELGWPVAVKASFGGGGRGMRVAYTSEDLGAAIGQASREAMGAFGRPEIFLEKFLVRPRHVEVQVLGDGFGNVVHLGDRDCSVQRRHQKVIEEAPAPNLSTALRSGMQKAAVKLARDAGYTGAGTVEFLVDGAGENFYFLEMNTRLQVEHGVTELISAVDIVAEQLRIADGEAIGFAQKEVVLRGAAMQARVTAEDAWDDFRPSPGRISQLKLPESPWLRLDFGYEAGDDVPGLYDSLIGKVQAVGRTREEARVRLRGALERLHIKGVPTTAPYLVSLLDQADFKTASHDTGSLERDWGPEPDGCLSIPEPTDDCAPDHQPGQRLRIVGIPWGGQVFDFAIYGAAGSVAIRSESSTSHRARARNGASVKRDSAPGEVTSPLDASVVSIVAGVGDAIASGTPLIILEAMKMEVVVAAKADGVLKAISVKPGDTVRRGAVLAEMTTQAEATG